MRRGDERSSELDDDETVDDLPPDLLNPEAVRRSRELFSRDRLRDRQCPVRYEFFRRPQATTPSDHAPPPVSSMARSEVRLRIYLTVLWVAGGTSKQTGIPHDITDMNPAMLYKLSSQPTGKSERTARDYALRAGRRALEELAGEGRSTSNAEAATEPVRFIEWQRTGVRGQTGTIRPLREDGSGTVYTDPGRLYARPDDARDLDELQAADLTLLDRGQAAPEGCRRVRAEGRYVTLPPSLWTGGFLARLNTSAIRVLLALLYERQLEESQLRVGERARKYTGYYQARRRPNIYGIPTSSWYEGATLLQANDLIDATRDLVPASIRTQRSDQERAYSLNSALFPRRPVSTRQTMA